MKYLLESAYLSNWVCINGIRLFWRILSSSQKALVAPDIIFAKLFGWWTIIVRSSIIMIDKRLILVLGGVYFVYSSGGLAIFFFHGSMSRRTRIHFLYCYERIYTYVWFAILQVKFVWFTTLPLLARIANSQQSSTYLCWSADQRWKIDNQGIDRRCKRDALRCISWLFMCTIHWGEKMMMWGWGCYC